MRTEELDFHLPPELIAQEPLADRASARLLHYRRDDRSIAHRTFHDLPALLRPGDLLVFNDTRVLPARFTLRKPTGGVVEALFVNESGPGRWRVLLKNLGKPPASLAIEGTDLTVRVVAHHDGGEHEIELSEPTSPDDLLSRIGRMPLPPYIRREKGSDPRDLRDRNDYQTIYARQSGAVAAPTAGLHFTPQLLDELRNRGIEHTFVTLHVGIGTFKPVTAERLEDHPIHAERYTIPDEAADALNRAKRQGRRIIPVGTTCARVLESQPADQPFKAKSDSTSIFIHPPYRWKQTSALITNFHLPRSTLIALVAALVGLEEQRRIYTEAIENRYRFFSYGDGMLLE